MKKLFLLAVTATAMSTSQGQVFYAQGGVNLANITKNNAGETSDNNMLTSFNAGLMGRFGISKVFDLETGLLFTGRGSKTETYFSGDVDNNYIKAKFNPYYIELPLNAVVKFPFDTKGDKSFFVNAGPYVAMGVGGKSKIESKFVGLTSTSTEKIEFNNDDPSTSEQEDAAFHKLKRFDFGANFGAGLDLGSVILKANYGLGLTKINSTETNNSDNDKNKYRTISFSVGIPLGR
jgi:hypothetical protein